MASIVLTVLSGTLGLYKFEKQEQKHVILNNKPNSSCQCSCGIWACIVAVLMFLDALLGDDIYGVIFLIMVPICFISLLKLCFDPQYASYKLYSKVCCKQIFKMDKVIVTIPNYCENSLGEIHYHLNVGYHPEMSDSKYIYVGKYKNDHYIKDNYNVKQVTEAVFWKIHDKSVCNVNRCSNIRSRIMFSLALISFCLLLIVWKTGFVNIYGYVFACFGIGLLESLCVSRLARCCVILAVFATVLYILILLFFIDTNIQSDVLFDGECQRTFFMGNSFMWYVALQICFFYCATLAMSNKESKKMAFGMFLSQMGSILDLVTDVIVIYVWINFQNYYLSLFQCSILVSSQLIQIYLILKKDKTYSRQNVSKYNRIKSKCVRILDVVFIVIGLGKLWFGIKKLANMNENNQSLSQTSFEMIKIWELLFESFPTLLLSSYILLNEKEPGRVAIVLSMIVSFSNLSFTLVKTMSKSKFEFSKKSRKPNVKVEQTMDDILFSNSNVKMTSAQSPNLELVHVRATSHQVDDQDDKKQSFSEPRQTHALVLWRERPYVKPQSKSGKKWIYFNYFVIWIFSITDSFIRFAPILMFVAFLDSVVSKFVSFFVFFIIFCAIFAFEATVLVKEKIVTQQSQTADYQNTNNQNNKLKHNTKDSTVDKEDGRKCKVDGLIYSFYCVITGSLYLLAFIQVPYLDFKVKDASFFPKYQSIRIIVSIFVLILLFLMELIAQAWYYYWGFWMCVVVFGVHFMSFYYLVKFII